MTDYQENGENPASDSSQRGKELFKTVEGGIEYWIADESIAIERECSDIVVDEDELVEKISVMIAIVVDEASS